ncbi:anaerobic sulfatase maturase [Mixta gaviniae]|uniref:Anaerobic sulfatase maturase n=1 Tax=Mixta gaviniae TaxID=665914 RepID=A0A2L0IK09_9GAMM|nr:anaerobic sulfatase maturase [Mixta gaviniae]AUX94913.1 anaerobic sulfatase maturase [Mixta gaviniae]
MQDDPVSNFQLMAKPGGALCNIACDYCFYLEKAQLYPERKQAWRMDDTTLENYIRKTIAAQRANVVDFLWQGGEPTLVGLDFYRRAVALQQRYRNGKSINNYFQTNGVNIDDKWAAFFKRHAFLVGVSLDGNQLHHDRHRKNQAGNSCFAAVMAGIGALTRHDVAWNSLTVVSAENVNEPLEVYRFLRRIGSRYMQFIPLVERKGGPDKYGLTLMHPDFSGSCRVADWSVGAKAWGDFLNRLFDEWLLNDLGQVFIMNFEQLLAKMAGQNAACTLNETCGGNLVIEANGDLYSCDHFVFPQHRLGNINHDDLTLMVNGEKNRDFARRKQVAANSSCIRCAWRPLCHGGCPGHRFMPDASNIPRHNYFCQGVQIHLAHSVPKCRALLQMMAQQQTAKKISRAIKQRFY